MQSILTVTGPASDRSLLTLAELRAAVGVSDNSQNAKLASLNARIAASITSACNVRAGGAVPPTLRKETLTETFRLKDGLSRLVLSRRPVVSVTSIAENDTDLVADDFEVDSGAGMLQRLCDDIETKWPCGKIIVVYDAGWATVPDDLKIAAEKLASAFWSEASRNDPNLKRERVDGVGELEYWVPPTTDPLIPSEVMDLLAPYRNYVV